ncbi:MAG TPA: uroporphyrinogen-III C-methyltransferase [Polyangiaceae bacterium]|nr:uroporphyrinogen-III C-methyltransferase [Polyangiaceae bacterium]
MVQVAMGKLGKVWLVGAGPGDPGLITVRGREVLMAADVVLYDALSHPALLQLCRAGAQLRDVGKRGGQYSPDQSWITQQLIELSRAGLGVVRLKGGDSFLFARGGEEALALAEAGIPFEIVPGLSSPIGTAAYAGVPLTHRALSSSVTFITGSNKEGEEWTEADWKKLATATDTICILMGMRKLDFITQALIAGGRDPATPSLVIQWGARPEQRVVESELAQLPAAVQQAKLSNPAIVIIGRVVGLRKKLRWYDNRPLFGKRILVPRAQEQAQFAADAIRQRAAEAVVFPVIEIHDPADPKPLQLATQNLAQYDQVLFTSANGVQRFFAELGRQHKDARALAGCKVGVIGPRTGAALRQYGVVADVIAEQFVGESLAAALLPLKPKRVLIPRALVARDELPKLLREAGAQVDVVAAYETKPVSAEKMAELIDSFEQGSIDVALFTSSSTVSSLCDALGEKAPEILGHTTVACIGPITANTAQERGLRVDVLAEQYTLDGLLDALEQHFAAA